MGASSTKSVQWSRTLDPHMSLTESSEHSAVCLQNEDPAWRCGTGSDHTFIPKRTTDYSKPSKKKPLWMNERTLAKVKKKSEAYKRCRHTRRSRLHHRIIFDYMTYCNALNQARRATRQALKAFEKEVARCAKTNPKTFYKYINSRTKVRVGISELHTVDQRAISDEEKATALNDFCVSVFTN